MKLRHLGLAAAAVAAMAFSSASFASDNQIARNSLATSAPTKDVLPSREKTAVDLHFAITDVNGKTHDIAISSLNGYEATWANTWSREYVSAVSAADPGTKAGDGGAQSTIHVDTLNLGLHISAVPTVLSNGDIAVSFKIGEEELIAMRNIALPGGAQPVELPETRIADIDQTVVLKPGTNPVLVAQTSGGAAEMQVSLGASLDKASAGIVASR